MSETCPDCTVAAPRKIRVNVCGEVITVVAKSGRQAKQKARQRYILTHDWFASDDPWRTTRHAEVLED